jgi:UDP-N-acetylmuramate dehydrogenase
MTRSSGDPLAEAERSLRATIGQRLRTTYPLATLTSFRIGGPARLFVEAESDDDLVAVSEAIRATGIPWVVIGKGSNVLVGDRGYAGLVIRLGRGYRWSARDDERLRAGASLPLPAFSGVALSHGLAGLEFGVAIPGSVGGAVRMNAGAHGRSMQDVVDRVDLFSIDAGTATSVSNAEAGFAYRTSRFPGGTLVIGVSVALVPGERTEIRRVMDEARAWRKATQPLAEANCGSVFKNPPDDHAARLVEASGSKGLTVGGATVSRKHANFIVAAPGATALDVVRLIDEVRRRVRDASGVDLETEVELVGEFDPTGD